MQRYRNRISGPILDRIDLVVSLGVPTEDELRRPPEFDTQLPARIAAARIRQRQRFGRAPGVHCNAQAGAEERQERIRLRSEARSFLRRALTRWDLSMRAHERTIMVARSIADLDGASDINVQHVAEALQYRVDSGATRD